MERLEPQYQSYLLRLWRDGEGKAWRAMLEHVDSHERHGFADMESLCTFLQTRTDRVNQSPAPPVGTNKGTSNENSEPLEES